MRSKAVWADAKARHCPQQQPVYTIFAADDSVDVKQQQQQQHHNFRVEFRSLRMGL